MGKNRGAGIWNIVRTEKFGFNLRNGGGGRMTQRVALRPSGRCLRQRFLATLESNLSRSFSSFPNGNMKYSADKKFGFNLRDGGGGRMTQRVALRPSGRCLRQRFLATLESNLSRSFSSFPNGNMKYCANKKFGFNLRDGGGGRIRTFEVDDGRFTVCSLWPLGNPTTG